MKYGGSGFESHLLRHPVITTEDRWVPDAGSAFQGRLPPICFPRLGIRGRSAAERAFDLGCS
jgi:hypothetical protein